MKTAPSIAAIAALSIGCAGLAADARILTVTDEGGVAPSVSMVSTYHGLVRPGSAGATDLAQLPGFPVAMGAHPSFAPVRGLVFVDLDGMYLVELDGSAVPGWPKSIPNGRFSYQSAALADLDADDDLEIVVGTHWNAAACNVFHHTGATYPGWPRSFGTWSYCAPTVTDLEGDGALEILDGRAGLVEGPSDCFWAWSTNGATKPGFPYTMDHGGSEGPLTVADIDGDGVMEIFADHNITIDGLGYLFGVDAAGNDLPGFPARPRGFTYMNGATIGDVDGDGDYEIGVLSRHDDGVDVNVYDLSQKYGVDGNARPEWRVYHARNTRGGLYDPLHASCQGDTNGDGSVDFDDILAVLDAWGPCEDCPADLNDDEQVNFDDLLLVLAGWGPCE